MADGRKKIVGIGGLPRSGKDTLAEFFMDHGYYGFSFGDYTRAYSRERHKDDPNPISVENMTETSNWLRETYGPDVILQAALKEFEEKQAAGERYEGLMLQSVRAPVEVDWILAHDGVLVWVGATDEVRHERGMQHLREGEGVISLDEFKRQEALQWQPQPGIPAESQMDIAYVKAKATKVLENNGNDIAAFKAEAEKILSLVA
jgi:dephospho-CoA kinase